MSVLEAGSIGSVVYIASELCECGDLAQWIAKADVAEGSVAVAWFMANIADAVQYMHSRGVLHLDLKPSNILLSRREESAHQDASTPADLQLAWLKPKISDFRISRAVSPDATQTHSSVVLGTLLYMAPEQLVPSFGRISTRCDIYSLGIIIAELLHAPIERAGWSYREIIESLTDETRSLPAAKVTGLPSDIQTIILKCTSADSEHRYATAGQLSEDLRRFAAGEPIVARRPGLFVQAQRWCQRGARIKAAWWICLACNLVMMLWMSVGIALIAGNSFPGADRESAMISSAALLVFNCLPMITLSVLGLSGRRWPLYPAMLLTVSCMVLVPVLVLLECFDAVPGLYDESPFFESLNHALVLAFGLIQTFGLGLGVLASSKSSDETLRS